MSKVLYISYDGMTDPLGQTQVIPYVEGLTDKGHEFIIMSYEKPERYKTFKNVIADRLAQRNISWKTFRYHKRFAILATAYDITVGFFYLLFAIPKNKIEILHCRSYIASFFGLVFKKLYGTKFIFDMRGFWADERVGGKAFKKGFVYKLFKKLEKSYLKNADATISLTRNAIDELKNWDYVDEEVAGRLHHITTCCNIDHYASTFGYKMAHERKDDTITFLFLGTIGPYQSFNEVTSFISFAYHYLPSSRFRIIVNWGAPHLEEYLKEENLDRSRFIIQSLTFKEIPEAIKDCDIGFFFYPPTMANKACSPTKMGEMMAAGIPVITGPSIGDVDELVNKNGVGFILSSFDENEIRKGIDFLVEEIKNRRNDLMKRCLSVAHDYYSLPQGVKRYNEIYQSVLKPVA